MPLRDKRLMNKVVKNLAVVAVLALTLGMTSSVWAAMSAAQVKSAIEAEYDARVLKIDPGKDNGRDVFIVKVMYNGGDYNTAFQVNILVIDAETGKPVSQFRHGASGRSLPGAYDNEPNRQPEDALRGHIWR
jgi:uncharacterized membrane protein YkoI